MAPPRPIEAPEVGGEDLYARVDIAGLAYEACAGPDDGPYHRDLPPAGKQHGIEIAGRHRLKASFRHSAQAWSAAAIQGISEYRKCAMGGAHVVSHDETTPPYARPAGQSWMRKDRLQVHMAVDMCSRRARAHGAAGKAHDEKR